ncbi:15199_t:CDS:2, partial [Acaulospora morrowiae]
SVVGYNISLFFLQTIVSKYGRYFRSLSIQGRVSQEFINRLAELLNILDTQCNHLEDFNIIVYEQTPGILELNPPSFSHILSRRRSRSLKLTCSAPLITFLEPFYFSTQIESADDSSRITNRITRAHLSFEGLSDIWVLRLINTCSLLQELVLERNYIDDNIEITDETLNGLCTLSELSSLAFISKCNVPLTELFTITSWKRMLSGTPKLKKIDISGLSLFFAARALPLIAESYRSRPLWLKHTSQLECFSPSKEYAQELANLIRSWFWRRVTQRKNKILRTYRETFYRFGKFSYLEDIKTQMAHWTL